MGCCGAKGREQPSDPEQESRRAGERIQHFVNVMRALSSASTGVRKRKWSCEESVILSPTLERSSSSAALNPAPAPCVLPDNGLPGPLHSGFCHCSAVTPLLPRHPLQPGWHLTAPATGLAGFPSGPVDVEFPPSGTLFSRHSFGQPPHGLQPFAQMSPSLRGPPWPPHLELQLRLPLQPPPEIDKFTLYKFYFCIMFIVSYLTLPLENKLHMGRGLYFYHRCIPNA